jgi:hypothetical protein
MMGLGHHGSDLSRRADPCPTHELHRRIRELNQGSLHHALRGIASGIGNDKDSKHGRHSNDCILSGQLTARTQGRLAILFNIGEIDFSLDRRGWERGIITTISDCCSQEQSARFIDL